MAPARFFVRFLFSQEFHQEQQGSRYILLTFDWQVQHSSILKVILRRRHYSTDQSMHAARLQWRSPAIATDCFAVKAQEIDCH
jgi:hypothetical protein